MAVEIRPVLSFAHIDQDALNRAVMSVDVAFDVGLSAECSVAINAWDEERGDFNLLAAEALYQDDEFEVWDLETRTCLGLFTVETRDVEYEGDGAPISVLAYDGLRRLMKETKSRVYNGFTNDYDWLGKLAEEHGLKLDSDRAQFKAFTGDRFKESGKTDLAFVTTIAEANGLGMPWVRYDAETGEEYLVLRTLNVNTQDQHALELRVTSPEGVSDFQRFHPVWDIGDIPTAVEVIGWDAAKRQAYRVTVVATPRGPKEIGVEYRDISAKERKQIAPGRKGGDPRGVVVHLLGERREQVDTSIVYTVRTGKARKRIRAKREYREILHTVFSQGVKDAREYARRWLAVRMEAYYVCDATLVANVRGAGRLRVSQAHKVTGALPDDNGWYILTKCTHTWSAEGHVVSFEGQRLITSIGSAR